MLFCELDREEMETRLLVTTLGAVDPETGDDPAEELGDGLEEDDDLDSEEAEEEEEAFEEGDDLCEGCREDPCVCDDDEDDED